MDINDLHPPDDYSHRFFIWHEWIQVCCISLSFYLLSTQSLGQWTVNQWECLWLFRNVHVLRQAKQQPGSAHANYSYRYAHCERGRRAKVSCRYNRHVSHVLTLLVFYRRFTGIEFAVVHAQPPFMFIIHKRERISPDEGAWCSRKCQILADEPANISSTTGRLLYREQ